MTAPKEKSRIVIMFILVGLQIRSTIIQITNIEAANHK